MTDDPILHTSLSRAATPAEIAADGHALHRIRELFPTGTRIMALRPDHAHQHLKGWVPFIEAGLHQCETLAGIEALMATSDALSKLEISSDLNGIREKISAAFAHIENAAELLAPTEVAKVA